MSKTMMINWAEVADRLLNNKEVKPEQLNAYFSRRHINPMIQWQWEALTEVMPAGKDGSRGVIRFPNGSTREFEVTRT